MKTSIRAIHSGLAALSACACMSITGAAAVEHTVATPDELSAALDAAGPGDEIVIAPGIYRGELAREGLRKVTIRSRDPAKPAVIEGGSYGLHLSDPVDVTISDLVFRKQLDNGINIDDAGSYETPATGIRLVRVTVRDMVNPGNNDGIKLAGVQNFVIDSVTVRNWGNEGSAIDFVGCHHGLVENSLLIHTKLGVGGSGIRPKGGSKDIVLRANRIELPIGKGRAIQAGGSTSAEFFRFADGDSGYEASEITAEGNVIVGAGSAFSWVNIDGGTFHHNVVSRPGQWVMRILNERGDLDLVATKGGKFIDNEVVFNDTKGEFNEALNVGDETMPESFEFARNRWFNIAKPTADGSRPKLPADEADGSYGEEPRYATDRPQVWEFSWGKWIVNANASAMTVEIDDFAKLRRAEPGDGPALFEPLLDDPLTGAWIAAEADAGSIELPAMSQVILIDSDACSGCAD